MLGGITQICGEILELSWARSWLAFALFLRGPGLLKERPRLAKAVGAPPASPRVLASPRMKRPDALAVRGVRVSGSPTRMANDWLRSV